jgi:hypothetical protein
MTTLPVARRAPYDPDVAPWAEALSAVVLTAPADRERSLTHQQAVDWLGCSPEALDAVARAGLPRVGDDPVTGGPLYDFHDVVNVGLAAGKGTSVGELGERALLRYARSRPDTWVGPRAWTVELTYRCGHGPACAGGRWQVAAPALGEFGGRLDALATQVDPSGSAVDVRVSCTISGTRHRVISPVVRDAYADSLDAFRDGRRRYQWLPDALRRTPSRALAWGVADCLVASVALADRLAASGFVTRTRTVTALGLASIDHAWAEVQDTDGLWKPLDPVFAYLAQRAGPRTEFAAFCCGSASNRVLPWRTTALAGVARHACAGAALPITSTIRTG